MRYTYQHNSASRGTIGQYYIKTCDGAQLVTCNTKLKCGGVEGGWMQIVNVDMNRDDTCPGSWKYIISLKKLCQGDASGCSSAHFESAMTTFVDKQKLTNKDTWILFILQVPLLIVSMLMGFPSQWDYLINMYVPMLLALVIIMLADGAANEVPGGIMDGYCRSKQKVKSNNLYSMY